MKILSKSLVALSIGLSSILLGGCYNFHAVEEGKVYRSAQPLREEMSARVRKKKIKTVLRLRNSNDFWKDQSHLGAKDEGAKIVDIYLSAHKFPKKPSLIAIVDEFENAEYPIMIHCKAGADRTGLVSGLWILWAGGTMERAKNELAAFPYGHLSTPDGTERMGLTLDLYAPWQPFIGVKQWAKEIYECPPKQDDTEGFFEANRQAAEAYGKKLDQLAK